MKSFTDIFKDFTKTKIYLDLFSRIPSNGCCETTPHDNFRCFDSKTIGHLILFWALLKQKMMSLLAAENNAETVALKFPNRS